jgi:poly(3-hydroxybutyrate) depolymerase
VFKTAPLLILSKKMDAAALYKEADPSFKCNLSRPLTPILELHGTTDPIATYTGARSHHHTLPDIRTVLQTWATRNGCGQNPLPKIDEKRFDQRVFYTQYDCGATKGVVVGYNVTGQGHWWISTEENVENGNVTSPVDASKTMMDFFNGHTREGRGSGMEGLEGMVVQHMHGGEI